MKITFLNIYNCAYKTLFANAVTYTGNRLRKKTFAVSPILRSPDNYIHNILRPCSRKSRVEKLAIAIHRLTAIDHAMLRLAHTLSKPPSMATLARSHACPDRVFRFLLPKIIIEKRSVYTRPYLADLVAGRLLLSYLVVHHHWINVTLEDSQRNRCTFVSNG